MYVRRRTYIMYHTAFHFCRYIYARITWCSGVVFSYVRTKIYVSGKQ